jgi:DNA topoisomerase IB
VSLPFKCPRRPELTNAERRKIKLAIGCSSLTQLTTQYKWWEQGENDGSAKWTTLHHNGILFPPPYIPLPKNVKMKYDGTPPTISPGQADRQVSH